MFKLLFQILKIGKKSSLVESKRLQIVVLSMEGYSERESVQRFVAARLLCIQHLQILIFMGVTTCIEVGCQ